jgi:hypothetical protein
MINSASFEFQTVLIALALGFVIFDIIGTMLSITKFVDPLDKLVMLVKKGHNIEEHDSLLVKIVNAKRFTFQIGVCTLVSVSFLIAQVKLSHDQLNTVLLELASPLGQIGGMKFAYVAKMKQMVWLQLHSFV